MTSKPVTADFTVDWSRVAADATDNSALIRVPTSQVLFARVLIAAAHEKETYARLMEGGVSVQDYVDIYLYAPDDVVSSFERWLEDDDD